MRGSASAVLVGKTLSGHAPLFFVTMMKKKGGKGLKQKGELECWGDRWGGAEREGDREGLGRRKKPSKLKRKV